MDRTLEFQLLTNLIHGDINESNVLYDTNKGHKLNLIDWDEALRTQPCHRQTLTLEEQYRYPIQLVNFPIHYTKQQLMHLLLTIIKKYYCYDHNNKSNSSAGANNHNDEASHVITGDCANHDSITIGAIYELLDHRHYRDHGLSNDTTLACTTSSSTSISKFLSKNAVDDRYKKLKKVIDAEFYFK